MPKQLLIMRHAKSSWASMNITDHQRTLNQRGLRDAPDMGKWVASQKCVPELILSSTAMRAVETAELFVENCAGIQRGQLEFVDEFYHAPPRVYLERLANSVSPTIGTVMVIGHNPGLEELVLRLSGQYETMSTAAIAWFRVEIESWASLLETRNAELVTVWRPKEIG